MVIYNSGKEFSKLLCTTSIRVPAKLCWLPDPLRRYDRCWLAADNIFMIHEVPVEIKATRRFATTILLVEYG